MKIIIFVPVSPRYIQSARSKSNNSFSKNLSELSTQKFYSLQYYKIYDYLRDSIRQIERHRNSKQEKNISSRVKRPQNEDSTLRQILGETKLSKRTLISRSRLTTTQTLSSLFNYD